ncbi:MAG TPA: TM2 domain-containing protein [Crenalkalicoccus sp.]|nr:TM2 domain-containing protein [Crenalkalicoccus sp.]
MSDAVNLPLSAPAMTPGRHARLSDQEKILIEMKYSNAKKSVGVAYLLLALTAVGHNFYLGRTGRGIAQLLLCCVLVGFFWVLLDWFTLVGTVKSRNSALYNQITMDALRG